tara:strand:+ start:2191 stop:2688 length:498 start_codon:yes stop_codon:yes gene_type:complete
MKDLVNILLEVVVNFIIAALVIYGFLCFGAYSLSADEALSEEERIVALTILGESRGEGEIGMFAVACVIQERARARKLSPAKVCLQRKQFSIWNGVKRESELHYLWKSKSMPYARKIARSVCDPKQTLVDVTGGANHYCNIKINPYWAKGRKPTRVIGNHKFFKL